jgi:hypothetical protein
MSTISAGRNHTKRVEKWQSCRIDLEELQDATDRVEVRTGCSYRPMPFALRLRKFRTSLSVV